MAITCGPFHLIARVQGPQTFLPSRLTGLCVVATPRPPWHPPCITLDNKAVVHYGPQCPHHESSDIDLLEMAACVIHQKSIKVRLILCHCQLSHARNT